MKFLGFKNLIINPKLVHKAGLLIVLFLLSNVLSRYFSLIHTTESMVRFNTGIIFIVYILTKTERWWSIFIFQLILTYALSIYISVPEALIQTLAESVSPLISAVVFLYLYHKKASEPHFISFLIISLSAIIGSAAGGFIAHYGTMYFSPQTFHESIYFIWTLSTIIGIVLISPVVIWWRLIGLPNLIISVQKMLPEIGLLLGSTMVITYLIFNHSFNNINLAINFPYLILPFIFWATIRFHPFILWILLFAESLLILKYLESGIFFFPHSNQPLYTVVISIQIFILFTLEFSYIMGGLILSRNDAQLKIKKLNDDLELRVNKRTNELQLAVEALLQSEEQFREAFDTAMHGMALVALDGKFLRVNSALCDMIGYHKNQLLSSSLRKITSREDFIHENKKLKKLISGNISSYQMEKRLIHREKLEVWVLESNSLITTSTGEPSHLVSQIVNITERKQSENQLRKYSETLTVLLREVNHRVKNNLAALISILHMEEDKAEIAGKIEYIDILKNLTNRIEGLSTVHTMLSAVNWHPLEIQQLCEQVIQAVTNGLPYEKHVTLYVTSVEYKINSNQAHHLAMILNELATNSVKYGQPTNEAALISVFIELVDDKFHLIYQDNGPGYPENLLNGDKSIVSTGFELIRGIITQSLDGEYLIKNEEGACIDILFTNELF